MLLGSRGLRCPYSVQSTILVILRIMIAVAFLSFPALCSAQEEPSAENAEPKVDAEGCSDLTVFPKLPASIIESCQGGNSYAISMPLKPDAQGYAREKRVRGSYEFRTYQLLQADQQEEAFDNLMQLLPIAGFTVKYSISPTTITARKEDIWILIQISGGFYNATVVNANEETWIPVKDADGISRGMQEHYRAAIYGIQFSEDNQTVLEENSRILGEILKYLKANPGLAIVVESHKMSEDGNPEDDQEITQKRATAIVAWLEAHGIATGRLQPKGLGRSKPVTENDTPLEIQRNERIELANRS
jgi:outer membrane protein OmpA-like peptidoglycan-associated protein